MKIARSNHKFAKLATVILRQLCGGGGQLHQRGQKIDTGIFVVPPFQNRTQLKITGESDRAKRKKNK